MLFPPRNVLAPTDFSEAAEPAVAYAFELAGAVGAKVHLLHAYTIPTIPENALIIDQLMADLKERGARNLRALTDKYQATGAIGKVLLKMGDPREAIVDQVAELGADLIVMGTNGRRGLSRVLLGSVAGHVVRTAPCPVLVIPPAEKR